MNQTKKLDRAIYEYILMLELNKLPVAGGFLSGRGALQ
jgi:hypothetical protein